MEARQINDVSNISRYPIDLDCPAITLNLFFFSSACRIFSSGQEVYLEDDLPLGRA